MFFSLLPAVSLAILTYNALIAAYNARDNTYQLMFVFWLYALVIALFTAIRALERTPRVQVGERGRLVAAIWVLSVLLNFSFAHRVVEILPPSMTLPVWCSAAGVAVLGFMLCFGMS